MGFCLVKTAALFHLSSMKSTKLHNAEHPCICFFHDGTPVKMQQKRGITLIGPVYLFVVLLLVSKACACTYP
jgi:hypothetical protein